MDEILFQTCKRQYITVKYIILVFNIYLRDEFDS